MVQIRFIGNIIVSLNVGKNPVQAPAINSEDRGFIMPPLAKLFNKLTDLVRARLFADIVKYGTIERPKNKNGIMP